MAPRLFSLILTAVLLPSASASAAPGWIKITSPNFEIYSNAPEGDARQTLVLFEQVRDFFMRVKAQGVTTRLPVTIVGFRNEKEFKPWRPNQGAAAYYLGDEQRDYIVMGSLGAEHTPTAIHEYMHLLMRHSGLKVPMWFNEGFAEIYSTLQPRGGQMLLGAAPAGHGHVLQGNKWLQIDKLLSINHESAEYNEKDRMGLFYAQSWIMTHMMMLGEQYRGNFGKFVGALGEGQTAERAMESVWGKKPWEVDLDAHRYNNLNSYEGVLFRTNFEKIVVKRARSATEVEVGITLAKLTALLNRTDDAVERFSILAQAHPGNAEVEEALAYLNWRQNHRDDALKHFERALEKGPVSWKTWWDYARLRGAGKEPEPYVQALRKVVELKPDLVDARMALGSELMRSKSWAQAFVTLREINRVEPEQASQTFLMLGYCAWYLNRKEARKFAADAQKWAREPGHRKAADELVTWLDRSTAPPDPGAVSLLETPERPRIVRGAQESTMRVTEIAPPTPKYENIRGNFKRLDCLGEMARMHVMNARETLVLLIRRPDAVTLKGGTGPKDMACGPQNAAVLVDYVPGKDAATHTSGEVRVIEFVD